jgi:hypothetical protein
MQNKHADLAAFLDLALRYTGRRCFIWPYGRNTDGYGMANVDRKHVSVHRIVCEKTHGPAPADKPEVAHSSECRDKACLNPNHLRWASTKENAEDRKAFGRHNAGERNGIAKLTDDQARAIRVAASSKKRRKLAEEFGISARTAYAISKGKRWAHIQ